MDQIPGRTGGDGAQGSGAAGHDGHPRHRIGAAGYGRGHVLGRMEEYAFRGIPRERSSDPVLPLLGDTQFKPDRLGGEPGDDYMNASDGRHGEDSPDQGARTDGPRGAGHAHDQLGHYCPSVCLER